MHTVLRLPQQTFHHSNFFNLSELGIKDLRSLTVACKSALFRCAACTVTHWAHWKTQLQTTAAETLPLSHFHDGSLSPPFWDSPPIAMNLSTAFAGFPGDQKCSGTTRKFVSSLFPDAHAVTPDSFSEVKRVQISLYKLYIKDVFPTDIHAHVIKRAQDLFFPFEVPLHALSLTPACKLLRGLRAHDAIRVLRTWVNAWCTSTRFHEEMRLPCLFGCFAEEDRQSHYSMCPHLFAIQRHLYPPTHSDPLIRIGLVDTSVDNLKLVACTYSAYHSLKFTLASKTNQDDLVPSPHPP